jgi:hypothetical protein
MSLASASAASVPGRLKSSPYAAWLRQELGARNREYAARHEVTMRESYGTQPIICYLPAEDGQAHGNFLTESYLAILERPEWSRRLLKVHTQARHCLPHEDRRWRELDSSNSSDALLMNVFCFPGTLGDSRVSDALGIEGGSQPEFGMRARVPLTNGRADRTEVDMRIGSLLVEAKLTEADFQSSPAGPVEGYRDFAEVFEPQSLPREGNRYISYQLIRNVLAAHAGQCSFCVMADCRRPDLLEAWFAVMRSIRILDLRLRCKLMTWQELAGVLAPELQSFLQEKYGIAGENTQAGVDTNAALNHLRLWI